MSTRHSFRETKTFAEGEQFQISEDRVRKVFFSCTSGKLLAQVFYGPNEIQRLLVPGFQGGMFGPGGGDYDYGRAKLIVTASEPSVLYIHFEWTKL